MAINIVIGIIVTVIVLSFCIKVVFMDERVLATLRVSVINILAYSFSLYVMDLGQQGMFVPDGKNREVVITVCKTIIVVLILNFIEGIIIDIRNAKRHFNSMHNMDRWIKIQGQDDMWIDPDNTTIMMKNKDKGENRKPSIVHKMGIAQNGKIVYYSTF